MSHDGADKIVLMRLGDPYVIDRADLRFKIFGHVVNEDVAVDLVCLAFEAAFFELSCFADRIQCVLTLDERRTHLE